jgi:hypothetical protein
MTHLTGQTASTINTKRCAAIKFRTKLAWKLSPPQRRISMKPENAWLRIHVTFVLPGTPAIIDILKISAKGEKNNGREYTMIPVHIHIYQRSTD